MGIIENIDKAFYDLGKPPTKESLRKLSKKLSKSLSGAMMTPFLGKIYLDQLHIQAATEPMRQRADKMDSLRYTKIPKYVPELTDLKLAPSGILEPEHLKEYMNKRSTQLFKAQWKDERNKPMTHKITIIDTNEIDYMHIGNKIIPYSYITSVRVMTDFAPSWNGPRTVEFEIEYRNSNEIDNIINEFKGTNGFVFTLSEKYEYVAVDCEIAEIRRCSELGGYSSSITIRGLLSSPVEAPRENSTKEITVTDEELTTPTRLVIDDWNISLKNCKITWNKSEWDFAIQLIVTENELKEFPMPKNPIIRISYPTVELTFQVEGNLHKDSLGAVKDLDSQKCMRFKGRAKFIKEKHH